MWLKGQQGTLRFISFSGISSAVSTCGLEWCLKTVLITFLVISLCGEISHLQEYLKLCKEYYPSPFFLGRRKKETKILLE